MIATIILGILSVFFAYIASYKNAGWGLKVSFILIYLFLALRYNFGNDYATYKIAFNGIAQNNHFSFANLQLLEPGWVLLNWIFRYLGFYCMTAILASINCIIYYRFISKHVPIDYYWFAVFLYIFSVDIMLTHLTAMRQSVAIMIFVFSLDYINKRNLIRYILCIILASLFHYTAILLLPVYFLSYLNKKFNFLYGSLVIAFYVLLIFGGQIISPYINNIIGSFYAKYMMYEKGKGVNSGLGYVYYAIMLIIIIYQGRKQDKDIRFYYIIAISGILVMPMRLIIEMLSRLGLYFIPASIIVYPNLLRNIKGKFDKIAFFMLIIVFTFFQFFQFFYSDTYNKYFMTYQTIFTSAKLK